MPRNGADPDAFTRITPLTAVETLPLVNCFGPHHGDRYRFLPSMFPALIIQLWMVMRYVWRFDTPISRCRRRQSICRSALPYRGEWPANAIRIMTGAPVPTGCTGDGYARAGGTNR